MVKKFVLLAVTCMMLALISAVCGGTEDDHQATSPTTQDGQDGSALNCGSGQIDSNPDTLRGLIEEHAEDYFADWSGEPVTVSTEVSDVNFLESVSPDRFYGGWLTIYQKGERDDVEYGAAVVEILVFADEETASLAFHIDDSDLPGSLLYIETKEFGDETRATRYEHELVEFILSFRAGATQLILNWNATPQIADELDIQVMEDQATQLCDAIRASDQS